MTKDEKDLLLKDISARLPYGAKAYVRHYSKLDRKWYEGIYTIGSACPRTNEIYVASETGSVDVLVGYDDFEIKPYLLPLSSMTIEKKGECPCGWSMIDAWIDGKIYLYEDEELNIDEIINMLDWLNKNHFDYRNLIPLGLAIDATNLNIY